MIMIITVITASATFWLCAYLFQRDLFTTLLLSLFMIDLLLAPAALPTLTNPFHASAVV